MLANVDFVSPEDRPALLAMSTPEWVETARALVTELGYKTHQIGTHDEFALRFDQIRYQVVVMEDIFGGTAPTDNPSLLALQRMPMSRRRHATVVLVGGDYQTLSRLIAFQQSVHAVVNYSDLAMLGHIVQKSVAENDLFLHTFRETQRRLIETKT
jgi:hypothetical protein